MSLEDALSRVSKVLQQSCRTTLLRGVKLPGGGLELLCRLPATARWNLLSYQLLTQTQGRTDLLVRVHRTLILRDGKMLEGGSIEVWAKDLPKALVELSVVLEGTPIPQAERVTELTNPFDKFYRPSYPGGAGGYAYGEKPDLEATIAAKRGSSINGVQTT